MENTELSSDIQNEFNDLNEKISEIEIQLQRIFWFIEFHLGEVPIQYRKLNPAPGEYPYFKTKTNFAANKITVSPSSYRNLTVIDKEIGHEQRKSALERMNAYERKAKEYEEIREQEIKNMEIRLAAINNSRASDIMRDFLAVSSSPLSQQVLPPENKKTPLYPPSGE